jgi:hypothetical protein
MVLKSNYVRANTFLLFPGLPLVEYAKQNGYLDKDFDMEKHVAEATEINIKAPYDREFRNVAALFWLLVTFTPTWIPFFKRVVSLPDNIVFRIIGSFNMVQELLFYRVRPIPALRYFRNTVLMTGKSQLSMTMRMWPSLFKRKSRRRWRHPKKCSRLAADTSSVHVGRSRAAAADDPRARLGTGRRHDHRDDVAGHRPVVRTCEPESLQAASPEKSLSAGRELDGSDRAAARK